MRSLLSLSWGLFADIDIESERFRWLGGARFTAQAVVRILFPRRYEGAKLRFKPLSASPDGGDGERSLKDTAPRAAATRAAARSLGSSVSVPCDDPVLAKEGWRELRDKSDIRGVWALNVPWGAEDMHAAPAAEASDGAYDVIVVRGASRLAMLFLLLAFDAGGHVSHPAVTYLKCSAFELTPGSAQDGGGGYVAVDGELVATAREPSEVSEVSEISIRDASEPRAPLLPGSPASWRVPYGPTRVRVRAGGARVFAAGGLNAADAA
jgi:sphingosine kinase